jgi:hypothetical protein
VTRDLARFRWELRVPYLQGDIPFGGEFIEQQPGVVSPLGGIGRLVAKCGFNKMLSPSEHQPNVVSPCGYTAPVKPSVGLTKCCLPQGGNRGPKCNKPNVVPSGGTWGPTKNQGCLKVIEHFNEDTLWTQCCSPQGFSTLPSGKLLKGVRPLMAF